jgi:ribosomal protein S14
MRNEQDGYTYRGSGKCRRCGQQVDYFRKLHWQELASRPRFRWLTLDAGKLTPHSANCNLKPN